MTRADYAWAVRFRYVGLMDHYDWAFCDRYWFTTPAEAHAGVTVTLFRTRRSAQRAIAVHRNSGAWSKKHWRASAVRVRVTVAEVRK